MRHAGLTLEQFDAEVTRLRWRAQADGCLVFPELWLMVNICSGKTAKWIGGDADAELFLFIKRYVDRWDEIKQTAHALASTARRTRPYTHTEAIADALERKAADERDGHYEALLWMIVCQVPSTGCPRWGGHLCRSRGRRVRRVRDARSDSYTRIGYRRTVFRRESPLSKIERGCRWQLLIGPSRMLSRVVAGWFPPPP